MPLSCSTQNCISIVYDAKRDVSLVVDAEVRFRDERYTIIAFVTSQIRSKQMKGEEEYRIRFRHIEGDIGPLGFTKDTTILQVSLLKNVVH